MSAPHNLENNMKRISKTAGLMGLLGIAVMSGASAATDDAFWYIGGNVGQSRAKIDDARISAQLLATGRTPISIVNDERNTAFKLLGGYQFNKNFAVEAGYFNLGQFGYTATTVPAGTLTGKIKLQGLNLDLVGLWPMTEKFSVLGRVGMNYAQAKDNFTSTGAVATPTTPNPSKNALNYKAGLGLQYDFTHALGMRVTASMMLLAAKATSTCIRSVWSIASMNASLHPSKRWCRRNRSWWWSPLQPLRHRLSL
jgi:OOP family OmpA-OmpF porin